MSTRELSLLIGLVMAAGLLVEIFYAYAKYLHDQEDGDDD